MAIATPQGPVHQRKLSLSRWRQSSPPDSQSVHPMSGEANNVGISVSMTDFHSLLQHLESMRGCVVVQRLPIPIDGILAVMPFSTQ